MTASLARYRIAELVEKGREEMQCPARKHDGDIAIPAKVFCGAQADALPLELVPSACTASSRENTEGGLPT